MLKWIFEIFVIIYKAILLQQNKYNNEASPHAQVPIAPQKQRKAKSTLQQIAINCTSTHNQLSLNEMTETMKQ